MQLARALPWLAYHLPADHPLRENLPAAARAAQARLVEPECRVDVGPLDERKVPRLVAALGGEPVTGPESIQVGPVEIDAQDDWRTVRLRPALLAGPDDPALGVCAGTWRTVRTPSSPHSGHCSVTASPPLRLPLPRAAAAAVAGTVASGQSAIDAGYAHDPARSAGQLVAEVAPRLGLGADAATLYLQLLALPDPTDRNVTAWTGWKPARLKAAPAPSWPAPTWWYRRSGPGPAGPCSCPAAGSRCGLRTCRWSAGRCPMLTLDEDGAAALSIVVRSPRRPGSSSWPGSGSATAIPPDSTS